NTVQLQDSEMSLDVGAIAKGYVADQIAAAVSATGVENFVINLGGNVVARGVDENGSPFKVGIQNPDTKAKETSIYNVELSSESLVTSGSYQRFYTVGDKSYHHIINPKTLFPENYYKSISVLSPSSVLSDNFSTALFNLSIEEGKELLKHFTTVKVLWVKEDGTIEKTDNFPQKK
ncbi:MAG: FAD:protein FMN transferase, partial [Clostridia bacterium]